MELFFNFEIILFQSSESGVEEFYTAGVEIGSTITITCICQDGFPKPEFLWNFESQKVKYCTALWYWYYFWNRIVSYCDIITVTQPNDDWLAYLLMVGQLWILKFEACQVIQLVMELYWVGTFNCLGWKQLQLHQFTVQQLISNQTEQSGGKASQHSLHMFHSTRGEIRKQYFH